MPACLFPVPFRRGSGGTPGPRARSDRTAPHDLRPTHPGRVARRLSLSKKKKNLDGLMCYASGACLKALRQRIRPVDRRGIPLGPAHPRDDLCGARPPARSAAAGERPFNKASPRNPEGVPQGLYSGKKRFLRASRCLFRFFPPVISWLCCWRKEKKERLRRVEKAGNGQTEDRRWLRSQTAPRVPLVRPVAGGRCWFVPRGEYCWLVAGGWFVPREKYC
jgi:hypothetical protein